ncbi:MAG: ATP F0F1 synthase subunit B [Rhodobacteraceae bacterium]|nr:ATP F0F1 synthase subunit B [Paracoccaceae bacterium]
MMRSTAIAILAGTPAMAASGPFFSLGNTDFVVLIAFIIFVGALIRFKAPHFAGRFIDGRIDSIRTQIDNAASIRADSAKALEDAKRSNQESMEQAERAIEGARREAALFVENAGRVIEQTVERRLQTAEEQIASAEAAAVAGVRNEAISVAIDAAGKVIAQTMSPADRRTVMNRAIEDLRSNLN